MTTEREIHETTTQEDAPATQLGKNPDPTTPAQDEDAVTPSTSGEHGQNTSSELGDAVKTESEQSER